MTQLTLGLDRDSGMELLAADFDERDEAVQFMLRRAIQACLKAGKYVGICGQGPSDHPDLANWLRDEGIARKSTRLNSSHYCASRLPSSACKQKYHNTPTTSK